MTSPTEPRLPAGACDCHVHVVGPRERYPMVPERGYTPPEASVAALVAFRQNLGIERAVIVQPSFYGTDNRCLVAALDELGAGARGVAVIAPDAADAALRTLHGHGVRGVRINLESQDDRDATAAAERLGALAGRVAPLGWHVQLFAAGEVVARLAQLIADLPAPVVIDHFGMPAADEGITGKNFSCLVELVQAGHVHVKLSAPYRISRDPAHADVAPIARALIEAAPHRMLWGSDWPHTNRLSTLAPTDIHPYRQVDDRAALRLVLEACGADDVRDMVLRRNPARLYDFPEAAIGGSAADGQG
ncbi:MAG: amidohydrolase family protein [Rhizobiales bacterium]|nr:amidohydrolase family protein [Hyphomicrobiales bacterium]